MPKTKPAARIALFTANAVHNHLKMRRLPCPHEDIASALMVVLVISCLSLPRHESRDCDFSRLWAKQKTMGVRTGCSVATFANVDQSLRWAGVSVAPWLFVPLCAFGRTFFISALNKAPTARPTPVAMKPEPA